MSVQFFSSHNSSKEVQKALEGYFDRSAPKKTVKFSYISPNDYGREIKKLMYCKPEANFSQNSHRDLSQIAKIENFTLVESTTVYSVRDVKLTRTDGIIIQASTSGKLIESIRRCTKRSFFLKNHSAVLTKSPALKNSALGNIAANKLQRNVWDQAKSGQVTESRMYYEGGAVFQLTNAEGKQKILVGEDLITITHQALRQDQFFKKPAKNSAAYLNETLIFKGQDAISKMYLSGMIPAKIDELAEELKADPNNELFLSILNEMLVMGLINKIDLSTEEAKSSAFEMAANYYGQRRFVKEVLIPSELQCPDIVEVPHTAYHLDILMTPGPNGSIFVQDYEETSKLLKMIQSNASALNLTKQDLTILDGFIDESAVLQKELGELMQKNKKILEDSGFHVIKTPGAFFSSKTEKKTYNGKTEEFAENVNFLNCISGYSKTTGHHYMAIPGTSIGDNLGKVLMDAYVEFLNKNCDNLAVYFIGKDANNPDNYKEVMDNFNRLTAKLGPHCLSFELATASVTI